MPAIGLIQVINHLGYAYAYAEAEEDVPRTMPHSHKDSIGQQ